MALPAPNLDDRKFQDIVSEARSKIPLYCPRWTDYNLSDPGITLIELFAWMVDMLLYRVNKVPEKNYIKFMDLIGVRLEPPHPAQVDLTFRLSGPQRHPVVISKGAAVATVMTETQPAIPFTTDEDLTIVVPQLVHTMTTADGRTFADVVSSLQKQDKPVRVFQPVPAENNAIYFGFQESLHAQTLLLTIDASIEGIGVDPRDPPLVWEYWYGAQGKWQPLRQEKDTTAGLNTRGNIILYIPHAADLTDIDGRRAFWLRCRATRPHPGQRPYTSSPEIRSLEATCIGGTVAGRHCLRVAGEILGRSAGAPGQRFNLHNAPVLAREDGEILEVETDKEGHYEPWQEVADFSESAAGDPHFTLDSVSGEVQFGPQIRQPSGEERQYGKIPPRDRRIRFTSYRYGGGVIGNVGKETLTVPKSSIPYVDSVTNFAPASGGRDAESLEGAMLRAPRILRNQTRAVTAVDFESLAVEASPRMARARCLAAGSNGDSQAIPPGVVRVLLVPQVGNAEGPIPREDLLWLDDIKPVVQRYLDDRRLLAMRVELAAPEYQSVAVEAQVRVKPGVETNKVASNVSRRLYEFINPVCGGPGSQGWPFGRGLFASDIFSLVQNTPDVDYIEKVQIFAVDADTGQRREITEKLGIPSHGLICSSEHHVVARVIEEQ